MHAQEVNNIYGMFRTRASLHQRAYQHKSVIAAERMYECVIVACMQNYSMKLTK
jgi:HD superfamily phosphohydrolase